METSEVLNKAADLIEERGWTHGSGWVTERRKAEAPLCLEGGIMAALGIVAIPGDEGYITTDSFAPLWTCPAYRAVADFLDRDVALGSDGYPKQALYRFNDKSFRAEVIETLRACAVIEAAKEADHSPAPAVTSERAEVAG